MKGMEKIMVTVLLCLMLIAPSVLAASCITMTTGGTRELTSKIGTEQYISLRIYNVASDGIVCDTGNYSIKAEAFDAGNPSMNVMSQVFDYSFNDNNIELINGENKQIQFAIKPKMSGDYVIKVTATRNPTGASVGASIVSTTSANIKVRVLGSGEVGTVGLTERPFWITHKNCPDGSVIDKEALCVGEEAEATGLFGFFASELSLFAIIAVFVVGCLAVIYFKK